MASLTVYPKDCLESLHIGPETPSPRMVRIASRITSSKLALVRVMPISKIPAGVNPKTWASRPAFIKSRRMRSATRFRRSPPLHAEEIDQNQTVEAAKNDFLGDSFGRVPIQTVSRVGL